MKYIFIIFIFFTSIYANNELINLENAPRNIEYKKDVKKYFTSSIKLGINVRKTHLKPYYKKEAYDLIWFNEGRLNPLYKQLIEVAKNDKVLSPKVIKSFNFIAIETLLLAYQNETLTPKEHLKLDFLLTTLYDRYINYLSCGSINWGKFKKDLKLLLIKNDTVANWEKYNAKVNKQELLQETLAQQDFQHSLSKTNFSYPNALKLYEKISEYELILENTPYTLVPTLKKSLKEGMTSNIVPFLKERLTQSNDYNRSQSLVNSIENIYDAQLVNAVKSFQKNHGLAVDGVCGNDTIKHLNISLESKIYQIKVNLERMRWMHRELGEEYLIVNIPDYNLRYMKNGEEVLKLSVVVGTKKHPTPIFSHRLSTVVLNPYWRVPQRIVQRELIPKLLKDVNYLSKQDIDIHENWDTDSTVYKPTDINWTQYAQTAPQVETKTYTEVPYKFIQTPGRKNPLGKMKFMFYNKYMVYLHDTSARYLFKRCKRSYSHGCIRVDNPDKLLKTIAKEDSKLDYKSAKKILKDTDQTAIRLKKQIPIHIVYLTAWLDEENVMQFRDDIYGYDKMQKDLLY